MSFVKAFFNRLRDFTAVFQRTGGASQNMDMLYQEDDALFGFFVKAPPHWKVSITACML
jgi:hypothetical protein